MGIVTGDFLDDNKETFQFSSKTEEYITRIKLANVGCTCSGRIHEGETGCEVWPCHV